MKKKVGGEKNCVIMKRARPVFVESKEGEENSCELRTVVSSFRGKL
jgi:hypothetical protein